MNTDIIRDFERLNVKCWFEWKMYGRLQAVIIFLRYKAI